MSKAIASTVNAYFKGQRFSLNQSREEIPEEVTVKLNGVDKIVANRKKASWDQLRCNVAHTGSLKPHLETEDAFVEDLINWLSMPPGKHSAIVGESAAKKQRTAGPLHEPADKKQGTATEVSMPSNPSMPSGSSLQDMMLSVAKMAAKMAVAEHVITRQEIKDELMNNKNIRDEAVQELMKDGDLRDEAVDLLMNDTALRSEVRTEVKNELMQDELKKLMLEARKESAERCTCPPHCGTMEPNPKVSNAMDMHVASRMQFIFCYILLYFGEAIGAESPHGEAICQ